MTSAAKRWTDAAVQVLARGFGYGPAGVPPDWSLPLGTTVDLIRKGTASRLGFSFLMALIAVPIAPPAYLFAWCAAVAGWELALRAPLESWLALPADRASPEIGNRWLAAINFVGTAIYSIFPALVWSTQAPIAMLLAAAWISATANHAFVYFSGNRLLLFAVLSPLIAFSLAAPFVDSRSFTPLSAAAATMLVGLIALAGLFGHDRRVLLHSISSQAAARAAAEQASAVKSQFLATMSHELRTPLNAVIGYAEIIEEDAGDAKAGIADDARKIKAAARRLLGLINVILDISRLESGDFSLRPERVAIASILQDVERAGQPLASANGNRFTIVAPDDLGEADLDAARVVSCVMNLVSNAAKFTRDGEIEVRAARAATPAGDQVSIVVSDTGIGIAPDLQAQIFEPLVRADSSSSRQFDGAGLGLAQARLIARQMGGDIACESAPGAGSRFTLKFAAS